MAANLEVLNLGSWHHSYRGRSVGRVLHFLYHYCGFYIAEHTSIVGSKVILHDEEIASFIWLSDLDIPHFTFHTPLKQSYSDPNYLQQYWESNQKNLLVEAIQDAVDTKPESCQECRQTKWRIDYWKEAAMKAYEQIKELKK